MNRKLRRTLKALGIGKKDGKPGMADIRQQYYQKCAEAGELQYKIREFNEALGGLNKEIGKLNVAYSELLAEERGLTQHQAEAPSSPSGAGAASVPAPQPSDKEALNA